ncbi:hypothetical protein [Tannockella kyphosi]|uniref:hypothetical protein n=1 Tax=Tannockella kyphosi TaxID=2899121 RepID=UPI0020126979|nr:hypothetical protein [Tannockella kyphosi]
MKRKFIVSFLLLTICLSLVSCTKDNEIDQTLTEEQSQTESIEEDDLVVGETDADNEVDYSWLEELRETTGCELCGSTDCPSLYATDEWGQDDIDITLCEEYDITSDPLYYCPICGKEKGDGTNDTCVRYLEDMTCYLCGEDVTCLECHTCKEVEQLE